MVGNYEEDIFFKILACCVVCFLVFVGIHWKKYSWKNLTSDVKTAAFLTSALLFLTPVLKSLTVSYSDDTIILLVVSKLTQSPIDFIVFILVHLFLYDYGKVKRPIVFDNIT
jgi:hypothetical protein